MGTNKNTLRMVLSGLIILAFFLPWFRIEMIGFSTSAFQVVKFFLLEMPDRQSDFPFYAEGYTIVACVILIPVSALIILIRSINKKTSGILLRFLPLLFFLIIVALLIYKSNDIPKGEFEQIFKLITVGAYLALISSVGLLFAGDSYKNLSDRRPATNRKIFLEE